MRVFIYCVDALEYDYVVKRATTHARAGELNNWLVDAVGGSSPPVTPQSSSS